MQIHNLKRKTPNMTSQQVGRGGKRGKTSGKGGKGQTARAGAKVRPEIRDTIKRLPKLRGRGKNSFLSIQIKPVPVSLLSLSAFSAGEKVTPKSLADKGVTEIYKGRYPRVKILSNGEIKIKVTVSECDVSAGAKAKIEAAGGTVK